MYSLSLSPSGIRYTRRDGTVVVDRPTEVAALLRFWHWQLDAIAAETTLGDLLTLLAGVDGFALLHPLLECDATAILTEAAAADPCRADGTIEYLEVFTATDATYPDAGGPAGAPFHIWRGFHGWGPWDEPYPGCWARETGGVPMTGGIAVEFTPVRELLALPIRYNGALVFPDQSGRSPAFTTAITITFGEFVRAIFWDLGFHGSPAARDAARTTLNAALAASDATLADEEARTED